MANDVRDDRTCFICGEKNPIGLKLRLRTDPERGESAADVTFPADFQGWSGIVHGGLVASVLDEALIYAAGAKGHTCVTGEITVRYVKPASTGVPYALKGRFRRGQGPHRPGRELSFRCRGPGRRQGHRQTVQNEDLTDFAGFHFQA